MNRRDFAMAAAGAAALPVVAAAQGKRLPIRKAVLIGMLPKQLSYKERFQLAKECGFAALEGQTEKDERVAEEIKRASDETKMPIHSVMNMDHWQYPLSSAKPEVVETSLKGMQTSLRNAKLWGADTVLLVPAVVNAETSYQDAWARSHREIRKLIPMATDMKINIGIEEVWNKFLLSPLEFAQYVDSFNSPYVKAYFDVGNVVLFGFPQDWIRTLGKRICKLHLKDFAFKNDPVARKRYADWVGLLEGEINWKEIHAALSEIGYRGDATVELSGGDATYLKDVSQRVDRILEGV